jgi:putative ABC transport system permease protein
MLKNYLKVAMRNLKKEKIFSLINIMGLSLGLACSLLILLWVHSELNMNGFNTRISRIFAVYERQYHDNKVDGQYNTPGPLADELKREIPEIEYACGYTWNEKKTFEYGDKIIKEEGKYAGADYFRIFSYVLLQGSDHAALNDVSGIAISRKMATDFFGTTTDAIGKTIRYENYKVFKVSAVFENCPTNGTDQFDFVINWEAYFQENPWERDWTSNDPYTCILLRDKAKLSVVEKKITFFLDNYKKDQTAAFRTQLGLQNFADTYLQTEFKNGIPQGGGIEYIRIFSIVGIFILLIACINFINLTTSRSAKRMKEIAVRKVIGAGRSALIRQFIGEALFLSAIAMVMALLLVIMLLPVLNSFTNKHIGLPFTEFSFWLGLAALTLVTGIISGSYPAFFLSSLEPTSTLKGILKFGAGAWWLRKGLTIFQFALSIVMIIGMMMIAKQVNYLQTADSGYNRENLIYIPLDGDLPGQYKLLKQEASKITGVQSISAISQVPTAIQNETTGVEWDGKDPNTKPGFTRAAVDYDFVKGMKLQLKEGRDFSPDFMTDSSSYLINESALRTIGYKDPIGRSLTFWGKKGTIIGVLKDFHFASLHGLIKPLIVRFGEKNGAHNFALLRIGKGQLSGTLFSLEKIFKALNPKFPFTYQFSDEEYHKLYKNERVITKLADSFTFMAIFISCLGLLGLAIFTIEQRIKEIAIRKVLGASVISLVSFIAKGFLILVLAAWIIAVPTAWWAMDSWLQNYAYRVSIGWQVYVLAGLSAILISLSIVSFHAIKAALINPVSSLRTQ